MSDARTLQTRAHATPGESSPGRQGSDHLDAHALAAGGTHGAGAPLPHLDKIQRSFGPHDVSGVRAHTGPRAEAATSALGARAFAFGNALAFKSASPDLHTAAHEAAHVVQQRAGVQLKGETGTPGDAYERHADAVADVVVAGGDAAPLLSQMAGPAGGGAPAVQAKALQFTGGGLGSALDPLHAAWGTAQTTAQPVLDPLQEHVLPWLGPVKKGGQGLQKMGKGAKDLYDSSKADKAKGQEKRYALADDGTVEQTKRGKDPGTTANAFRIKAANRKREKGVKGLISGGSKVGATVGQVASMPLIGTSWGQAVTGVSNIVGGVNKMGFSGVDAGRGQRQWSKARDQEHALHQQGDLSAYGFQAVKHHSGDSRNKHIGKVAQGAIKATGGVVDTASALDPTMVVAPTVTKGLSIGKHVKKAITGVEVYKEERRKSKVAKAHDKAAQGDQEAMQYLLSHDPMFASAQLLMHAQDEGRSEQERDAHTARVGKALRFGQETQDEMKTGSLGEFDKLYKARTGRGQSFGAKGTDKLKTAPYMPAVRMGMRAYGSTIGKLKKKRRSKKNAKLGLKDAGHLNAVEQEFHAVQDFRAEKQVDELQDKLQQKDLKKRFKLQEEGDVQGAAQVSPFEYDQGVGSSDALEQAMDRLDQEKDGVSAPGSDSGFEKLPDWLRDRMVDVLDQRRAQAQAPQGQPVLGPPPNRPPPPVPVLGPPPNRPPPPVPVLGPPPNRPPRPVPGLGPPPNRPPPAMPAAPDREPPAPPWLAGHRRRQV